MRVKNDLYAVIAALNEYKEVPAYADDYEGFDRVISLVETAIEELETLGNY